MTNVCYCTVIVKKNAFIHAMKLHRKKLCVIDTVLDRTNAVFGWINESKLDEVRALKYIESVEVDKTKVVLTLPSDT